ncbi:MAG: hypothetical protein NUV85_02565 [Candidatus Berkelbacteria bacterium]|nr:hypothetical protein [Candidatus Berkelbacteria bacterium]
MNFSDLMLGTPLGAIIIIFLLALAAVAAWGAYRERPQWGAATDPPTPPAPPKKEEPKQVPVPPLKTMTAEPVSPCRGEEPCAEERKKIASLERELSEVQGRLANANKALSEKPKETAPEKKRVGAKNVMGLLSGLGDINSKAANDIRNETKKEKPAFETVRSRLEVFSIHLAQRGYEKTESEQLFQLIIEAQKK